MAQMSWQLQAGTCTWYRSRGIVCTILHQRPVVVDSIEYAIGTSAAHDDTALILSCPNEIFTERFC